MSRLNNPEVIRREYSTDERLRERRLDVWGEVEGGDPEEIALAALAEARPKRVLDAGCGSGLFASQIEAAEVVAVDSSSFMVEQARQLGVEARTGDIESLPFADRDFDAAACNWTLYHLRDLDRGLAELARVIRPGGRLVAITNSERHLEELWATLGRESEPASFTAENGAAALGRHFRSAERRDVAGSVMWSSREAVEGYLGALRELIGEVALPEISVPFRAARHNCVFIAER